MNTSKYRLQKTAEIAGESYEIRTDYSAVLDIFEALNDPNLTDQERAWTTLTIFYTEPEKIPEDSYEEAVQECFRFLRGGQEERQKKSEPVVVDWKQDWNLIVPPINRVLGYDIRSVDYDPETNKGGVHWHTVLSAYMEIGDCFFAQVVAIRSKKARGKPLDKQDREFYRRNRDIIDIKKPLTEAEQDILKEWM